jgi:Protein of unknown function (DUF3632)
MSVPKHAPGLSASEFKMASEPSDVEPLDLQLFRDDSDDEGQLCDGILHALVNGNLTPSQAAANFDAWIVNDTNVRLEKLMKRPDPRNLTPEEEERGESMRAIAPNPSGCIELAFQSITKLCSAFPPYHPGQDRILQFIKALRALPEHQVPAGVPAENSDDSDQMLTLWPFGGNWMALAEVFRMEANGMFSYPLLVDWGESWLTKIYGRVEYSYPYSDIETPGSETRLRWRNWQSAIARITASGFIDCSFLCALGDILPSSRHYPDLEKRRIGGPKRIGGDVIAGAQWILRRDEGRFVYRQCKPVERVDGPRAMWSMERWRQWKDQLAFVAGDQRFESKARLVAQLASQQMAALEEEIEG